MASDDQNPYASSRLPIHELQKYPTPLEFSQPNSDGELFVFWSFTNQSHDPGSMKSTFLKLQRYPLDVMIQFWSPGKPGCITTYDQPFALKHLDPNRQKHRLCSLKYQYVIDANKLEVKDDPNLIISGPPENAFRNHLAEVVMDLRVHQEGNPLMRSALECGFLSCFVMPICHPSQRCCVGVVECFAKNYDDLLEIFMGLADSLQGVGQGRFHGQEYLPHKTMAGLRYAMYETEGALQKVCQAYNLSLAQVSIAYRDGNVASLEHKQTKQMLALKLIAPYVDEDDEDTWLYIEHCGSCDMAPLRIGEGLAGKALENYEPHFRRNIYEMTNTIYEMTNTDHFPAISAITKLSCLVICLRSTYTDNLDYVFEFLWPRYRNHSTMIESIMSTLKTWLPHFKFACGAQLGDELRVIEVGNSSKNALQDLMTLERDLDVKRKCERSGYGIDNRRLPKRMKRKGTWRAIEAPSWLAMIRDHVAIKVVYKEIGVKCRFPPSPSITLDAVKKCVAMKFGLTVGQFELTYYDEDGYLLHMLEDGDVKDILRTPKNLDPKIHVNDIIPMIR